MRCPNQLAAEDLAKECGYVATYNICYLINKMLTYFDPVSLLSSPASQPTVSPDFGKHEMPTYLFTQLPH